MIDENEVQPEVADVKEVVAEPKAPEVAPAAPAAPEAVSPQVSAGTAHVYGLIEHLKSEWLALEEKFNKALADLRSHL